jgi:hypothetical protein
VAGIGGFYGSKIIDVARAIMAICTPATGQRATGKVKLFTHADTTVALRRNHAMMPVIDGAARSDLLIKSGEGPLAEGAWEITPDGTEVDVLSNVGGVRHNVLTAGTKVVLDPPVPGIVINDAPTVIQGLVGGLDTTGFGAVKDVVLYEQFDGPDRALDTRRSLLKRFPAVLLTWEGLEPADGVATAQTARATRLGTRKALYSLTYTLSVISSRADSDEERRHEGLAILDLLIRLLADRQAVDGYCLSNPSGLYIQEAHRESGPQDVYQKFYIYTAVIGAMATVEQIDLRTYNPWLLSKINGLVPQEPDLPNQGDFPIVIDTLVQMG